MYSPKIAEELIPELYRVSKARGKPMTRVVDEILREAILKTRNSREINFECLEVKEASGESLTSPSAIAEIMKVESKADRECFWVLHLSTANKIIEKEVVSIGTVNKAAVYPREVFKKAILNGTVSIVTVHNHPGNHIQPSDDDKKIWEKLDSIGKMLSIITLDHLIITPSGRYYSRKENM